jgi:hypothetical protein
MLGRLFGLTPLDSLARIQRHHDVQVRFEGDKLQANATNTPVPCIPAMRQRSQVVRLLQLTDPSYDAIVRRGRGDEKPRSLAHFQTQRDEGKPVLLPALFNRIEEEEASALAEADLRASATMEELIADTHLTPRSERDDGTDIGDDSEYAEDGSDEGELDCFPMVAMGFAILRIKVKLIKCMHEAKGSRRYCSKPGCEYCHLGCEHDGLDL